MFFWLKNKKSNNQNKKISQTKELNFKDNDAKILLQEIKDKFGLDYEKQKSVTLQKMERFAIKNGIGNFQELKAKIDNSMQLQTRLINMLTVTETYFYRELGHLKILVNLMKEKNIKKILCVPSSSGEEVYSILMYLQERQQTGIFVTGVDLNSDEIAAAKKGCYLERSLYLLPKSLHTKYFQKQGDRYCVSPLIKKRANFLHQNIFDASFLELGRFDAIFCRNMFIYFNNDKKAKALSQIHALLPTGGILFIGHADISFIPEGFIKKISDDGNYFIKV